MAPSNAQETHRADRTAATFYQPQRAAQQSRAAALSGNVPGAFKADPEAPIRIEADRLVEAFDGGKQMLFSGTVKLQQGDFQLRTRALTAFYLGQSGLSNGAEWRAEQLIRVEARGEVLLYRRTARRPRPQIGQPST